MKLPLQTREDLSKIRSLFSYLCPESPAPTNEEILAMLTKDFLRRAAAHPELAKFRGSL